jgi:hypothetical protein
LPDALKELAHNPIMTIRCRLTTHMLSKSGRIRMGG